MNSSNETFYPLEYWFGLYGFPYIIDAIFVYATTPVWFLSLILSILTLFILRKDSFNASNFFTYMRLYVLNCLILSIFSPTIVIGYTRNFFSITNTYEAVFYSNYIFMAAEIALVLFSSCIEICLVVERILYLLPRRYMRIKCLGFKRFFFILFICSFLVNFPSIFLFEPAYADVQLDENTIFRIWYAGIASFSFSLTGQILNYLGYLLRDILPMILKLILNVLSIYLVRKYVKNKQRIRATTTTAADELVNFDRKQTYVALLMSTFSIMEHILYISSYVLYFFYYYDLSNLVFALALLIIAIKHSLIFFVLLLFNNLFRNEVKSFLNL